MTSSSWHSTGSHAQAAGKSAASSAAILICTLLAIGLANGCTPFRGLREQLQYNDGMNDFVLGWRNSVWARQAWEERKYQFVDEPQFVAFGQGFRDGYADVASGGSGCVPAIPPRRYWTWKYQTGEGQAKVAAWFAGYPHGARAAQEDGAGNFQQIQVSHLIEQQYSPEFQAGFCPGCDPRNLPTAPGIEVVPGGPPPALTPIEQVPMQQVPAIQPAPGSPAPLLNPTSHMNPPQWNAEAMTRTPGVMPAAYMQPVVNAPAATRLPAQ